MNKCRTCDWWEELEGDFEPVRKCWSPLVGANYPIDEEAQENTAYVLGHNWEYLAAYLGPGPDFGCIHHTENK
jgi:hypothetical protein